MFVALVAWLAPLLLMRIGMAMLRKSGSRSARPLLGSLLLQDAAVVAEGVALSALLPVSIAWAAALMAHLFYGLDTALLSVGNLRLEPTTFRYLRDARRLLPVGAAFWLVLAALGLGLDAALLRGLYLPPGNVLPWLVAVPPLWLGALLASRAQSPALLQGWSNGLFDWQVRALAARREARAPALSPGALHPDYPLLRVDTPTGAPVFNIAIGAQEKPHVVLLFLESFRAEDVGALGDGRGLTPAFDALAREGVLFTRYYTHSHATSRSVMSGLYGVLPPLRVRPTTRAEHPPRLLGLPQLLAARGYDTAFFHNGPAAFEELGDFLQARGVRHIHDDAHLRRMFPQAQGAAWGLFDETLYAYHAAWLQQRDAAGVPTFSTLLTMTHHYPWEVPPSLKGAPANANALSAEERFALTCRYADQCLGAYMDTLRAAGLDKKTIFIVTGDTGQQMNADFGTLSEGGYLRDTCYHIPLLMLAPGRLDAPRRVDWLASHADLLQTVRDMLGAHDLPHHGMGESLLRLRHERPLLVSQPERPLLWGARQGTLRFNHYVDTGSEALFDVHVDPEETTNLAALHPESVATLRAAAERQYQLTEQLFAEDRFVPEHVFEGLRGTHSTIEMAPSLLPASLEQAQAWLEALQASPELAALHAPRYKVLRVTLTSAGLNADERLQYVRLRLKKLHSVDMGALSSEEAAQLKVLASLVEAAEI